MVPQLKDCDVFKDWIIAMFSSHEFCRISLILLMAEIYPNWDVMKLLNRWEKLGLAVRWDTWIEKLRPGMQQQQQQQMAQVQFQRGTLQHGGVVTTTWWLEGNQIAMVLNLENRKWIHDVDDDVVVVDDDDYGRCCKMNMNPNTPILTYMSFWTTKFNEVQRQHLQISLLQVKVMPLPTEKFDPDWLKTPGPPLENSHFWSQMKVEVWF